MQCQMQQLDRTKVRRRQRWWLCCSMLLLHQLIVPERCTRLCVCVCVWDFEIGNMYCGRTWARSIASTGDYLTFISNSHLPGYVSFIYFMIFFCWRIVLNRNVQNTQIKKNCALNSGPKIGILKLFLCTYKIFCIFLMDWFCPEEEFHSQNVCITVFILLLSKKHIHQFWECCRRTSFFLHKIVITITIINRKTCSR